ncbi:amidohydrolase 2 [Trametopsis cervina]|nr:amidohydrolase 2 [Trametopsis cervina]
MPASLTELTETARRFPAIDNHAHPLLKQKHRDAFSFEGLISEATGDALTQDAVHTLACFRATLQLSKFFNLEGEPSWEAVKKARQAMDYGALCSSSFDKSHIQCILIDDGLGGSSEFAEDYNWHDQFMKSPTKRIVRVEILAEDILKNVYGVYTNKQVSPHGVFELFDKTLRDALGKAAMDPEVVGFKSIACYRTGLNITVNPDIASVTTSVSELVLDYSESKPLRLEIKDVNDWIVNLTLEVSSQCGKPVQFHTGLGDSDITLALSSPSHMQPVIKAYPNAKIVLLHSSYPYTRDAGYLTAVYPNVYLDFGEIFPFLSAEGQIGVIRQVLELCPTNKILWSTDGHWWPESYYLGTVQAREALLKVLGDTVLREEMTEAQAVQVIKNALFYNANRIYNLNLTPQ